MVGVLRVVEVVRVVGMVGVVGVHTVASQPYSIHLGKKILILNHSKVKSSQSEVQIGVSIL